MKLFTLNFLTCATRDCRAAAAAASTTTASTPADARAAPFPLQVRDAELARTELDFQPAFWPNVLPRIEWAAMRDVLNSVGLKLPDTVVARYLEGEAEVEMGDAPPEGLVKVSAAADEEEGDEAELDEPTLRTLHGLLMETQVQEGLLVCARCGHRYAVKEGIANFLLPPHLV